MSTAPRGQSQEPRWLWFQSQPGGSDQANSVKADPDTGNGTDKQKKKNGKQKGTRPGQPQALSRPPSHGPLGSPVANIVSLSSLDTKSSAQQNSAPPTSTQRATPMGMPSFPVGSTTGIVGRSWPGQPQNGSAPSRAGPSTSAGEGRGTKRAGGDGESKGKKRQRRGDREKSAEGEGQLPHHKHLCIEQLWTAVQSCNMQLCRAPQLHCAFV